MPRKVFFSFHYKPDSWRVAQVRNAGVVEGNKPVADNDWETVTRGGDPAIKRWIDDQMKGRTCAVVLIGAESAGRKWIEYEIERAWNNGLGVVGVHIHNLKNALDQQSRKGINPLAGVTVPPSWRPLSGIVRTYDPPFTTSTSVYAHIRDNLEAWVDEAIAIRCRY